LIIAAYDFGTTGCKASLYGQDDGLIATAYHPYPTHYPQEGWVEQDPHDWKTAFIKTTQALFTQSKIQIREIACIAFSGHMMGCVPVDAKGEPLVNRAMLWADNRSRSQADRIVAAIGWETFYAETGGGLDVVTYPAAKIPWIKKNQPDLYRQSAKFVGTKDVICAWLTGNVATDFSDASNTGLLHLKDRVWHQGFLRTLGIDRDKMPQLLPSTSIIGKVSSTAARTTGFLEGTPVVLGGGDVACGSAGAGSVTEGVPYMCVGSAAWVSVATREPIIDPAARPMTVAHVVPDLYTSQIIMFSAGVAYKWARDEIFFGPASGTRENPDAESFDEMNQLAATSPTGSKGTVFLPYMRPGGAPHYDLNARGAFVGLNLTTTKADLLRASMEGIAFNVRAMLEHLEGDRVFDHIRIIGGGSKSDLWRQIFADVLKKRVLRLSAQQEANTLGAALVGGVAIRVFEDFSAVEKFAQVDDVTSFDPEAAQVYDDLFPVFEVAYRGLKKANESLGRTSVSQ